MILSPKTILLKNGRQAVLRSPAASDAAAMAAYLKTCSAETEFLIRYPEECTETVEQEAAFLEGANASPDTLMLVCEVDGEIAGNCQLSFNRRIKTRHRASVAIALLQRFWGMGIGTAMFEAMIAAARAQGALQLELDYVEGNERAKRLYGKMGFVQVAERPDAIRLKDGRLLSEISMLRKL